MTADLSHRTFLVTGTTSGIGRTTAVALAARGATVLLASRSSVKNQEVVAAIRAQLPAARVEPIDLDLSSFASIRRAADGILSSGRPLDVLINNAGIANTNAMTVDGFDLTYATNHIGPFLLTSLLLPRLLESKDGRVVNVASEAHRKATRIDWTMLERRRAPRRSGFRDYCVTKLMNILHARELARRTEGTTLTTYALHPGVVASDIWRSIPGPVQWLMKRFMLSNEEGAATTLYCATDRDVSLANGRYYDKCNERGASYLGMDRELASELWARTEAAIASR